MSQTNVQELQRTAILKMLSIGASQDQGMGMAVDQSFKVLIYDKYCQNVIAPLLKVGGLRKLGVTLHLAIDSDARQPVADVPAVYFVEPTTANIQRINQDLANGLYENCYINFASSVTRSLMEELARGAMTANAAQKVVGVFDRYVSFVSLGGSLFSLNLPAAYETIHSPLADQIIEQYIERIVDGLLSVLITTRTLPIIRCPPGEAAQMVGQRLDQRVRQLLATPGGSELFSATGGVGAAAARGLNADSGSGRPLLCVVDRDVDLVTMLNHTWTYQAMCQDVLGMKLNQLNVPVDEGGSAGAPPKPKQYDVDSSDAFWVQHAGAPFPEVAGAVHEAIEAFNVKRASMNDGDENSPDGGVAAGLAAAMNSLPEMTNKKRSIDMHTNIATALLQEVKARELDNYYEIEDKFGSQSLNSSLKELGEIINDPERGTLIDKTRALMVLYLTKPAMTPQQLEALVEALRNAGGDTSSIDYLKHNASMRNLMGPQASQGGAAPPPGGAASTLMGNAFGGTAFGGLAAKMAAGGEGLLAAGMNNVKNLVASKKELPICKILDALMEQKPNPATDNFVYFDPKAPAAGYGQEQPRMRQPFRKAIAFVVGGGNYAEMQSIQDWATEKGRQVTYGSTDMISPTSFVDELSHLGQAQGGGGGGSDLS